MSEFSAGANSWRRHDRRDRFCPYYGLRLQPLWEMALLCALIHTGSRVLNGHMLIEVSSVRSIGWLKIVGVLKDMKASFRDVGHAHRHHYRPAGAAWTADPARDDRLRAGHRSAACSRTRRPSTRSVRLPCAPSFSAPARASSGTCSSRATTISDTRPWSAPRCATPSIDRDGWTLFMLGFSNNAWKLAPRDQLHRMDTALSREEPSLRGRQPEIPDPALDQCAQPGFGHRGPDLAAPAR